MSRGTVAVLTTDAVLDRGAIATALALTETGEAHLSGFEQNPRDIIRLKKASGVSATSDGVAYAAIGPIAWLAFNTKADGPTADKKVRQAIAYATDREFITKALHRGVSKPQRSPIIESSPFFNEEIPAYDVDLEKAAALLDEAGFPAGDGGSRFGLSIDFIPGTAEQQQNIAEYLRSQLGKIGIDISVRPSPDFPTWAQRIASGDFDLTMDNVFNWGDPVIGVHRTYLGSNIRPVIWANTQGYSNPKVDEILAQAAVELDQDKRKALYDEFQMIVGEDLPVYWINATPYHTAYDERLGNPPLSIWGPMQSMDEVYWKEPR